MALYLSLFEDVQEALLPKYTPEERWKIVEVEWLDMVTGGVRGMEHFNAKDKKWLQPHIGGRFAIFRVLE